MVNQRDGQTLAVTLRDDQVLDFSLLGTRTLDDFFSPGATLQLFFAEPFGVCDFDGDGLCDASDVDALVTEIAMGGSQSSFDLNSDGVVDRGDLTDWRRNAATQNGLDEPYLLGDANLDGIVDAADLNRLALNWNQDVTGWSAGDFTADGTIGPADLNVVGLNWQQSNLPPQPSAVPEPRAKTLTLVVLLACFTKRRRLL